MMKVFKSIILAASIMVSALYPSITSNAADTATVYVLSKYKGDDPTDNFDFFPYTTIKYSYDQNGLLIKRDDGYYVDEYSYDGGTLNSAKKTVKSSSGTTEVRFEYDEGGRLKTVDYLYSDRNDTFLYDKNGLISGKVEAYSINDEKCTFGWSYSYDDSEKTLLIGGYSSSSISGYKEGEYLFTANYDGKGRPTKAVYNQKTEIYRTCTNTRESDMEEATCAYKFSDGRLTKAEISDDEYGQHAARKYYYKKINVPKKYAKTIKEQQYRIMWNDYVLGQAKLFTPGESLFPVTIPTK